MLILEPTVIHRELNAMPSAVALGGLDTVDTEIVDKALTGTSMGYRVQLHAEADNGFYHRLTPTGGQIQETPRNLTDPLTLSRRTAFLMFSSTFGLIFLMMEVLVSFFP